MTVDRATRAWKEEPVTTDAFELGDRVAVHGTWVDDALIASLIEPLYEASEGSINSRTRKLQLGGRSVPLPAKVELSAELSRRQEARVLVTYRVNRVTNDVTPYRLASV